MNEINITEANMIDITEMSDADLDTLLGLDTEEADAADAAIEASKTGCFPIESASFAGWTREEARKFIDYLETSDLGDLVSDVKRCYRSSRGNAMNFIGIGDGQTTKAHFLPAKNQPGTAESELCAGSPSGAISRSATASRTNNGQDRRNQCWHPRNKKNHWSGSTNISTVRRSANNHQFARAERPFI